MAREEKMIADLERGGHDAKLGRDVTPRYPDRSAHEFGLANGLYSVTTKGFDGVDWPPGGVFFLQNGLLLGGSSFMYYIGSYTCSEGIFKGECVAEPHTPPPASHLYFDAKEVGVGLTGTCEGDQADLTGTVFFGKRSLTLQLILRKVADI
jgi:hypothetical protein